MSAISQGSGFTDRLDPEIVPASDLGLTFDHFALATQRIRDLLPLWRDTLGGVFTIGGDSAELGWRTVRLAFDDRRVVELIEPIGTSRFLERFFERHPYGGVHHVTFTTTDLTAAHHRLAAAGYQPFGLDTSDPDWMECFVHPRDAHGLLLQVVQTTAMLYERVGVVTIDDVLAGRGWQGTGVPST